jgi:Flp pilus assembly protein TadG
MKIRQELAARIKDEYGATAILVALVIVVLISITALAVDIGYVMATKNEVQNISDAAALAATRQLGHIYEGMSYEEQQSYVCDPATIIPVAKEVALKNKAAGKNIVVNDADIIIGQWNAETKILTPTFDQPDAVKVISRRDGSANGPITTFFARIFGVNTVDVSADATAALTAQSTADKGGLPFPAGISKKWFEKPEYCEQPIKFYPTGDLDGCAGWHTYDESPASANRLRGVLGDLKDGTYESPPVQAGETKFTFTGGTVASAFDEMKALFDAMKVLNDGVLDADENPETWTTSVVVYDWDDCSNPHGDITIAGFAAVTITEIQDAPDKIIQAKVICDMIAPDARGGGGEYGTKGSIPGLVE